MALFGSGSVLWGILWGMDLTLKLLIRYEESSVRKGQGVSPGQEGSSDTTESGGETVNQADIKQKM